MTKETIEVQDLEVKLDKNENKYLRVKTDKGWMSCFKSGAIDPIKENKGKRIQVETTTAGKFTNIEKFYGKADPQSEDEGEVQVEKPYEANKGVSTDRSIQVDRAKALELALKYTALRTANADKPEDVDVFQVAETYFNYITKGE